MTGATVCTSVRDQPFVEEAVRLGIIREAGSHALVDSRGLLGSAAGRATILSAMEFHLREFGTDVIVAGVANSGSLLGALLAERTGSPFVNVLVDGPRSTGLGRRLEPDDALAQSSVVLVDNWIASGKSMLLAGAILERAGATIVAALTVSASPDVDLTSFRYPVHVALPYTELLDVPTHHSTRKART